MSWLFSLSIEDDQYGRARTVCRERLAEAHSHNSRSYSDVWQSPGQTWTQCRQGIHRRSPLSCSRRVGTSRKGNNHEFVRSPSDSAAKDPVIAIDVPTDEEILRFAAEFHQIGKAQRGANGQWLIIYRPAGLEVARLVESVEYSPENCGRTTELDDPIKTQQAEFEVEQWPLGGCA